MSRKISNYFLVKPKNASKNVGLASSSTATSEDVEGGDGDAEVTEVEEHRDRVEGDPAGPARGDPAGPARNTVETTVIPNDPNQPRNF